MMIRSNPFHIQALILSILLVHAPGCKTTEAGKHGKEASTLRFHLEVNPDGTHHSAPISVLGIPINVEREPFLNESNIAKTSVVDTLGSFAIKVQFDQHGSFVLENTTTAYKDQRIAVFSQFGQGRWLAAPVITQKISDGIFIFTPHATRDEAERIVRGVNNVVQAIRKRSKF